MFQPFGGAVDIIVVKQEDGSLKSSPWYVKFGKLQGVLKRREKLVKIEVNGVEADFQMFMDSEGDAFFLREEESEASPPIPQLEYHQTSSQAPFLLENGAMSESEILPRNSSLPVLVGPSTAPEPKVSQGFLRAFSCVDPPSQPSGSKLRHSSQPVQIPPRSTAGDSAANRESSPSPPLDPLLFMSPVRPPTPSVSLVDVAKKRSSAEEPQEAIGPSAGASIKQNASEIMMESPSSQTMVRQSMAESFPAKDGRRTVSEDMSMSKAYLSDTDVVQYVRSDKGRATEEQDPRLATAIERELAWRNVVQEAAAVLKDAPLTAVQEFEKARQREADKNKDGNPKKGWGWFRWRFAENQRAASGKVPGERVAQVAEAAMAGHPKGSSDSIEGTPFSEEGPDLDADKGQILAEMIEIQWSAGRKNMSKLGLPGSHSFSQERMEASGSSDPFVKELLPDVVRDEHGVCEMRIDLNCEIQIMERNDSRGSTGSLMSMDLADNPPAAAAAATAAAAMAGTDPVLEGFILSPFMATVDSSPAHSQHKEDAVAGESPAEEAMAAGVESELTVEHKLDDQRGGTLETGADVADPAVSEDGPLAEGPVPAMQRQNDDLAALNTEQVVDFTGAVVGILEGLNSAGHSQSMAEFVLQSVSAADVPAAESSAVQEGDVAAAEGSAVQRSEEAAAEPLDPPDLLSRCIYDGRSEPVDAEGSPRGEGPKCAPDSLAEVVPYALLPLDVLLGESTVLDVDEAGASESERETGVAVGLDAGAGEVVAMEGSGAERTPEDGSVADEETVAAETVLKAESMAAGAIESEGAKSEPPLSEGSPGEPWLPDDQSRAAISHSEAVTAVPAMDSNGTDAFLESVGPPEAPPDVQVEIQVESVPLLETEGQPVEVGPAAPPEAQVPFESLPAGPPEAQVPFESLPAVPPEAQVPFESLPAVPPEAQVPFESLPAVPPEAKVSFESLPAVPPEAQVPFESLPAVPPETQVPFESLPAAPEDEHRDQAESISPPEGQVDLTAAPEVQVDSESPLEGQVILPDGHLDSVEPPVSSKTSEGAPESLVVQSTPPDSQVPSGGWLEAQIDPEPKEVLPPAVAETELGAAVVSSSAIPPIEAEEIFHSFSNAAAIDASSPVPLKTFKSSLALNPEPATSSVPSQSTPENGTPAEGEAPSPTPTQDSMPLQLSLCRHLMHDRMGLEAAARVFNTHRVTLEQFSKNPKLVLGNDRLVARVASNYYPWSIAGPKLIAMLAFGQLAPPMDARLDGALVLDKPDLRARRGKDRGHELEVVPAGRRGWWPFGGRKSNLGGQQLPAGGDQLPNLPLIRPEMMMAAAGVAMDNSLAQEILHGVQDFYGTRGPRRRRAVKCMRPTDAQLASLPLREGRNTVVLSCMSRVVGRQQVECSLHVWRHNARVVISDVDGTITKSDVLGQVMPLVGRDWSQSGVARLFTSIKENGYELMFLSARSIAQAFITRNFLFNLRQDNRRLPEGPMVISPDGLFPSLYREVIKKVPQEFKIAALADIKALFPPDRSPFYAGFGNRETDAISYEAVGVPRGKIFIINPKGEVTIHSMLDMKSYTSLHDLVHDIFPAINVEQDQHPDREDFNNWNYWKMPMSDDSELPEL